MIKSALVAMTVMGCDCDAKVCEYIGQTPARWTSVADCQSAMKAQIEKRRDLNYPVVSGVCEPVAGAGEMLALQIPQPAPSPDAIVPITPDPARQDRQGRVSQLYTAAVDGGRVVFRKSAEGYVLVRTGVGSAVDGAVALVRWTASSIIPRR